jgi:hypothetical protein
MVTFGREVVAQGPIHNHPFNRTPSRNPFVNSNNGGRIEITTLSSSSSSSSSSKNSPFKPAGSSGTRYGSKMVLPSSSRITTLSRASATVAAAGTATGVPSMGNGMRSSRSVMSG